jgi:hypothetical protein
MKELNDRIIKSSEGKKRAVVIVIRVVVRRQKVLIEPEIYVGDDVAIQRQKEAIESVAIVRGAETQKEIG